MTPIEAKALTACIRQQDASLDVKATGIARRIDKLTPDRAAHHLLSLERQGLLVRLHRETDGWLYRVTPKGYEAAGVKPPLWVA